MIPNYNLNYNKEIAEIVITAVPETREEDVNLVDILAFSAVSTDLTITIGKDDYGKRFARCSGKPENLEKFIIYLDTYNEEFEKNSND